MELSLSAIHGVLELGKFYAIADCGIDLVSCTTGLYFPHSSTFLIRSHMPWGARETLWLDLSVVHCPFVPKGLEF